MPRKKQETQEIKVNSAFVTNTAFEDITDKANEQLNFATDTLQTINLGGQEMSVVEFAMYVTNMAQKVRNVLSPVEQEIMSMFLDVMSKHAIVVAQELQALFEKKKQMSQEDNK